MQLVILFQQKVITDFMNIALYMYTLRLQLVPKVWLYVS